MIWAPDPHTDAANDIPPTNVSGRLLNVGAYPTFDAVTGNWGTGLLGNPAVPGRHGGQAELSAWVGNTGLQS